MIEISHRQAQRLIRELLDRRLPDEQWAALQAHLERCPECRAYRARLQETEKDLRHALRQRWSSVNSALRNVNPGVLRYKQRREHWRHFLARAWQPALVTLLVLGFLFYRQVLAPSPAREPVAAPTVVQPTLTPTIPHTFQGLVAFEARMDGNAEIYLLNASAAGGEPDLTNLTQDPGQDTGPAWSPDGDWLAFFSDRSGKKELYVIYVAGSRLMQLTNAPGIAWDGIPEWSANGQFIALRGQREAEQASWLYLVPLDGGLLQSIALTRNAPASYHFSPAQSQLAFFSSTEPGSLALLNLQNGSLAWANQADSQTYRFYASQQPDAFDWSADGTSLAYIANGPYTQDQSLAERGILAGGIALSSEVRLLTNRSGAASAAVEAQPVMVASAPERFRAVSWAPGGRLIAALAGQDQPDCWTVRLAIAVTTQDLNGLCVDGRLQPASWTADGSWLVLLAHTSAEPRPALYALRVLQPNAGSPAQSSAAYELLADLSAEPFNTVDNNNLPLWANPSVRPDSGHALNIHPRPVQSPPPARPELPGADAGQVLFTVPDQPAGNSPAPTQIEMIHADGSGLETLLTNGQVNACPRFSPDGKRMAFTSSMDSPFPENNEVYVKELDGQKTLRLTSQNLPVEANGPARDQVSYPLYDCPVWSPDSKLLAVVARSQTHTYLGLLPVDDPHAPPRFWTVGPVSRLSDPLWEPVDPRNPVLGAQRILLVYPQGGLPAKLMEFNLRLQKDPAQNAQATPSAAVPGAAPSPTPSAAADLIPEGVVTELIQLTSWDDVKGLALSPDGKHLAFIALYYTTRDQHGPAIAQLRVLSWPALDFSALASLTHYNNQYAPRAPLAWLGDGQVGLVTVRGLVGPGKTEFDLLNLDSNRLDSLARFDDLVYQARWRPDGWLIFSAESGLWALHLNAAADNRASPALLSSLPAQDLDWSAGP